MIKKVLFWIFIASFSLLQAQVPKAILKETQRTTAFDENYRGSIYRTPWKNKSTVIYEKSGSYECKLRYNIYTDALETKEGSTIYTISKSHSIHSKIMDEYYYYCEFKTQRKRIKKGYFVLIDVGDNYNIYKKYTLSITDPDKKGYVNNGTSSEGYLKPETTYYLEQKNIIVELPLRKNEMIDLFESHSGELEKIFKKEKIKLKKEEDLIRFVSLLNAVNNDSSSGLLSSLTSDN